MLIILAGTGECSILDWIQGVLKSARANLHTCRGRPCRKKGGKLLRTAGKPSWSQAAQAMWLPQKRGGISQTPTKKASMLKWLQGQPNSRHRLSPYATNPLKGPLDIFMAQRATCQGSQASSEYYKDDGACAPAGCAPPGLQLGI